MARHWLTRLVVQVPNWYRHWLMRHWLIRMIRLVGLIDQQHRHWSLQLLLPLQPVLPAAIG